MGKAIDFSNEDRILTDRFEDALVFAFRLHIDQKRKSSNVPYIAHLLSVTAIVLENGGDENEAIAALLHDAVEDQGGQMVLKDIQTRYGEDVAEIVLSCSDTDTFPKPPWRDRKEYYLAHLNNASDSARLVSLADKIHNLRDILRTYRIEGENTWKRFRGGKDGTLWYYHSLVNIFEKSGTDFLTNELRRVYDELINLVAQSELNSKL